VWVGGFWPNLAPFRRAAQWDGVYPLNRNEEEPLSPADIRSILEYVHRFRTTDAPFDIANSGYTSGTDPDRAAQHVGKYADAGLTWWMENINPFRFGWQMQGPWPVEAMRERILQGPPKL